MDLLVNLSDEQSEASPEVHVAQLSQVLLLLARKTERRRIQIIEIVKSQGSMKSMMHGSTKVEIGCIIGSMQNLAYSCIQTI